MNSQPLVTFALFTYNQEAYIREAVRSALAQTYSPLQIVFSDDSSTDATFSIIEEEVSGYCGPHQILLNCNTKNLGIGGHVNRVMELARGELIVAAAGDDISLPERVSQLVAAWESSGYRADSLHSAVIRMTPEGKRCDLFSLKGCRRTSPHDFIKRSVIIGATHAWTKRVFDKFGKVNPNIVSEDRVIGFRSSLCGGIQYIDVPLVMYRLGGISSEGFKTLEINIQNELKSSHLGILHLMQNYNDYMCCSSIQAGILRIIKKEISKKISQQVGIVAKINGEKFVWLRNFFSAVNRWR
jgi:glycosyltransferase involved in cell wall biosynthesis